MNNQYPLLKTMWSTNVQHLSKKTPSECFLLALIGKLWEKKEFRVAQKMDEMLQRALFPAK